jgi:excisionase family DNA binding protein
MLIIISHQPKELIMIDTVFLTKKEAAEYARTSTVTLDRWIRGYRGRPQLRALKVGRKVMIDRTVLRDWLLSSPEINATHAR